MTTDSDDFPAMPEDWWPETLKMCAEHSNMELAFIVRRVSDGSIDEQAMTMSMKGLRLAMWQALQVESRKA